MRSYAVVVLLDYDITLSSLVEQEGAIKTQHKTDIYIFKREQKTSHMICGITVLATPGEMFLQEDC